MRKLLSMAMILVMAMVAPLLVGCGSDSGSNDNFIPYPNSQTKKYEKINFTQVMSLGDVRGAEEYGSDWGKPIIVEEPSEIFVSGIRLKKVVKYDFFSHEQIIDDVGAVNYVGYFPLANIVAMRDSGCININTQPNSSEAIKSFIDKILTNWDKGLDMQYDVTFTLNGSITSVKCNGEEPTPIPPQAKKVYLESFGNYQVNVTLDESEPKAVDVFAWTLKVTCGNAVKYLYDNDEDSKRWFNVTLNSDTGKSGKVEVTDEGKKQLKAGQTYVCTLESLVLVDGEGIYHSYVGDKEIVINIPEISNEELRLDPTEIPQFTTNEVIKFKPSPDKTGDSKPTELQKPIELGKENKPKGK